MTPAEPKAAGTCFWTALVCQLQYCSTQRPGDSCAPEGEAQLLVEVAVVQRAVPAHRHGVSAHDAVSRARVEAVDQQLQRRGSSN